MCHAACHVMKLLVQLINLSIVLLKVICYNKGSDNITGCQDGQAVDMLRACGGGGGGWGIGLCSWHMPAGMFLLVWLLCIYAEQC